MSPAPSLSYQYVTAMAKGRKGGFALKGGDAQASVLLDAHVISSCSTHAPLMVYGTKPPLPFKSPMYES